MCNTSPPQYPLIYFNFVYLFSVLVFFVGDFWWSHLGISGRVPKVPAPKELKEPKPKPSIPGGPAPGGPGGPGGGPGGGIPGGRDHP